MDPIRNPYSPNAGTDPDFLGGRARELEDVRVALGRMRVGRTDQSMIVTGLRGVGKTVLLNRFEDLAFESDFIPFYHEVTPDTDLLKLIAADLTVALRALKLEASMKHRIHEALQHLAVLKAKLSSEIEMSIEPGHFSEDQMTHDLTELFLQAGQAAREKDRGIMFLLDELQFIKQNEYRAIISALHRASNQRRLPITLAGAGLPQIPKLSGDARSYAERLFKFVEIEQLSKEEALKSLVRPAEKSGCSYQTTAAEEAVAWSHGYPFFIQVIGKYAWNLANNKQITLDDVLMAEALGLSYLDESFYKTRADRLTEEEQTYLCAMASIGDGPYSSGDIIKCLGKTHPQVSMVRSRLIHKGMIFPTSKHGEINFSVPLFADFIRRTWRS